MKRAYLAITTMEDGKYYSYALPVSYSDNLVAVLGRIKGICTAEICPTKKEAERIVTSWNDGWKRRGLYMFDEPAF